MVLIKTLRKSSRKFGAQIRKVEGFYVVELPSGVFLTGSSGIFGSSSSSFTVLIKLYSLLIGPGLTLSASGSCKKNVSDKIQRYKYQMDLLLWLLQGIQWNNVQHSIMLGAQLLPQIISQGTVFFFVLFQVFESEDDINLKFHVQFLTPQRWKLHTWSRAGERYSLVFLAAMAEGRSDALISM